MANEVKALPLFPIYLYEDGFEPPKSGTYYLVTGDGLYIHKETKAGSALVPVKGIPWLQKPSMEFRLKLPKIPGRIIGQALTFFRKVFQLHKAECYVTLMYSAKLNQYRLWCPKQKVSMTSVNYDRTDQPTFEDRHENDWQMVGTIHSHCDFGAYHSGKDTHDESTFDGVHITLGHVNRPQFSMAASIAINDKREPLEPENCSTGVVRVGNKEVTSRSYMTWGDCYFFDLELSEADAQQLVADTEVIEKEWMPKVEKQTWGGYSGGGYSGGGSGLGFRSGGSGSGGVSGSFDDEDRRYGLGGSDEWWH